MKFRYQKIPFYGHDPRKPFIARPFIPVYLYGKIKKAASPYYALLDSGADTILFPSDLAKAIGINDITNGKLELVIGIAGQKAEIYFHAAELEIVDDSRKLSVTVGFSDAIFIPILGRSFFRHFKSVIFSEPKEEVEFKN